MTQPGFYVGLFCLSKPSPLSNFNFAETIAQIFMSIKFDLGRKVPVALRQMQGRNNTTLEYPHPRQGVMNDDCIKKENFKVQDFYPQLQGERNVFIWIP